MQIDSHRNKGSEKQTETVTVERSAEITAMRTASPRRVIALVGLLALSATVMLSPSVLTAQASATTATPTHAVDDHIALGDKATAARDARQALTQYEAALALAPRNYDALWKASGAAIDLGEVEPDEKKREALNAKATGYARTSISVDSAGAEANFAMARGLGRTALTLGSRDRVKYAKDVHTYALKTLAVDPRHAGALHVLGVWNAEVMRLNSFVRAIAKSVLGGAIFSEASWKSAVSYMEQSVAADPARAVHHLDLARVYADMGRKTEARAQYSLAIAAAPMDANDSLYQKQAADELKKLK